MNKEVYTFKLDDYVWDIASLSIILFFVSFLILKTLGLDYVSFSSVLDVVIPLFITLVFHEGLHYVTAIILGYKARVGYGKISFMPVFYTTVSGKVKPYRWLIVCLAPLVFSPLMLFPTFYVNSFMKNLIAITFSLNLIGSSGDLILAASVKRMRKDTTLEDKGSYLIADEPFPKPYGAHFSAFLKAVAIALVALFLLNLKVSIEFK